MYVFDVQTFTDLVVNVALSPLQCPATSFIKGVSSGATGFVETTVSNSTAVKLDSNIRNIYSWRANYNKW